MKALCLLAIALPSFAINWCPRHIPFPTSRCNSYTLQSALPKNAFIETINEVWQGECFGEDTNSNIFYCWDEKNCCPPGQDPAQCSNYAIELPPSCALIVNMGTYRFGLIMPMKWSGSLLAVGSYSYGGGINWKDMWTGPKYYNLATLSTDTGHRSIQSDMRWAKGNKQAQIDWGFRSIDGSTKVAKSILGAYYVQNPLKHSYYSGCSTGGRQGLKQLQLDQSLFDGLLIGAPAWSQTHMLPWITKLAMINPPGNPSSIYNNRFDSDLIRSKIREVCDGLDGIQDSIISRPDLCNITKVAHNHLRCGSIGHPPGGWCLQPAQIKTLIQIYQDYMISNSTGQSLAFPAPEPGAESDFQTWLNPGSTQWPHGFNWQWEKNFLNFPEGYKFTDDVVSYAELVDPGNATARPELTDWAAFHQRGGKLILYHGLADGIIPARSTTQYYKAIGATSPAGAIDEFARYYQVPGMHHCFTSDQDGFGNNLAPWMFGGMGQQSHADARQIDAILGKDDRDMFKALMNWVEGKSAPSSIRATTWWRGTASVSRQRPLCPYPQRAVNTDPFDINNADSWECRSPHSLSASLASDKHRLLLQQQSN